MINHLKLTNVGPTPDLEMDFARRLNIFTGDNGLGKTFLLDVIWWTLSRTWPSELNPKLISGQKALPTGGAGEAMICFRCNGDNREYSYRYQRREQAWIGESKQPGAAILALYAMSDGSFALWDQRRNYRRANDDDIPAYIFSPPEVWDGLAGPGNTWLCNGLIRDWANWQNKNGVLFNNLKTVLKTLSPSSRELLEPGELTRISLRDVRDIPTIRMSYQHEVPIVHASAGIRRILALAYFLVWAWEEHKLAAERLGEAVARQVVFLIDEIEAHLHPSWQRSIVPALLSVMETLDADVKVQLITTTHAPLIMTSVEPFFTPEQDAWFDFNFERAKVVLRRGDFEKHGDAGTWLVSEAFDLKSGRSTEYEKLVEEAAFLLEETEPNKDNIKAMYERLIRALGPKDTFLFNWRALCFKKGWIE
jgi:hypothetical protein